MIKSYLSIVMLIFIISIHATGYGNGEVVLPLSLEGMAISDDFGRVESSLHFSDIGSESLGDNADFSCQRRSATKYRARGVFIVGSEKVQISGICYDDQLSQVEFIGSHLGKNKNILGSMSRHLGRVLIKSSGEFYIRGVKYRIELRN